MPCITTTLSVRVLFEEFLFLLHVLETFLEKKLLHLRLLDMRHYYMTVSHKDWELPNSRI